MKDAAIPFPMPGEQNQRITEIVEQEQIRLRNFVRSRVPNVLDAEDILQDVLSELVEANRLLMPIEHVTGWLFRVARNRITDLFRKRRMDTLSDLEPEGGDEDGLFLEDLLPSADEGPDGLLARKTILSELELALGTLPEEQRVVFVAHEIEERSFREMAEETGVNVNTLLARKRYAVLALRRQLQHLLADIEKEED